MKCAKFLDFLNILDVNMTEPAIIAAVNLNWPAATDSKETKLDKNHHITHSNGSYLHRNSTYAAVLMDYYKDDYRNFNISPPFWS